jgi:hypothetical protein
MKEQPKWAQKSGGLIPDYRFIKQWQTSSNLTEVQKKFWWKTEKELKAQRGKINRWMKTEMPHVKPLKPLQGKADWGKQKQKAIAALLDAGILEKKAPKIVAGGTESTIDRTGLGAVTKG